MRPPSDAQPILARVVGFGTRECSRCGKTKLNVNWVVLTDNMGFQPICDDCVSKGAKTGKEKQTLQIMDRLAREEARNPSA